MGLEERQVSPVEFAAEPQPTLDLVHFNRKLWLLVIVSCLLDLQSGRASGIIR